MSGPSTSHEASAGNRPANRLIRIVAAAALAAVLAGPIQLLYFKLPFGSREPLRRTLEVFRYRKVPGLERFCRDVRARVPVGSVVLFLAPYDKWDEGYSYTFYRAAYLLGGRTVLPAIDPHSRPLPAAYARAGVVVGWKVQPRISGFETFWTGTDGVVLRRVR